MFHLRLDKVKIDKNREEGGFFGLGRDLAELEFWSFVVTDNQPLPDVSELLTTTDSTRKKELVLEITKTVLGARQIKKIDKIKDGAEMLFGFDLWRSPTPPTQFDWNFVVIEIDEDQRKTAQIIQDIVSDNKFEQFAEGLPGKLTSVANPGFQAVVETTKLVVDVITTVLENSDNDTVGILYKSFNQAEHFPTGRVEEKNVQDITNNMWVDFSMYSD
jgi:hypothetical protein